MLNRNFKEIYETMNAENKNELSNRRCKVCSVVNGGVKYEVLASFPLENEPGGSVQDRLRYLITGQKN